jgi:hypothetical protein
MPKTQTLKKPAAAAAPAAPPMEPVHVNSWDRPEWIVAFKELQAKIFEPARRDVEVALKKARCTATEYYAVLGRFDALTADACDFHASALVK